MTVVASPWRMPLCAAAIGIALALSPRLAPAARATCPCTVIDAYTPLRATALDTDGKHTAAQIAAYRGAMIQPRPWLYAYDVLGLRPGPGMDAKILASLAAARADHAGDEPVPALRALIASASAHYARFADFRCDFWIYLADSLGQFDGAGRVVDGGGALVFGVDVLRQEEQAISLSVLVHHDLFHRYHFRSAGFSDDLGDRQVLWRVLWAEGLATYVSLQLTPGANMADALLVPRDLEQAARPVLPRIASDVLDRLDRIDPRVYRIYFTYGNPEVARRGLPWRSGYYLGYRVAGELAKTHSLGELVHLRGDALHAQIEQALRKLAVTPAARSPRRGIRHSARRAIPVAPSCGTDPCPKTQALPAASTTGHAS